MLTKSEYLLSFFGNEVGFSGHFEQFFGPLCHGIVTFGLPETSQVTIDNTTSIMVEKKTKSFKSFWCKIFFSKNA